MFYGGPSASVSNLREVVPGHRKHHEDACGTADTGNQRFGVVWLWLAQALLPTFPGLAAAAAAAWPFLGELSHPTVCGVWKGG